MILNATVPNSRTGVVLEIGKRCSQPLRDLVRDNVRDADKLERQSSQRGKLGLQKVLPMIKN